MRKEDLKDLASLFDEVKDSDESEFSGFEQLPDGIYKATVDDLEVTESKAGNPMFVLSYKIKAGDYKGYVHKQFIMLSANDETQLKRNINRFATTVKKLGIDTSKGLENTIKDLSAGLDKEVIITLETTVSRNGKSYTNTSFELV